MTSIQESFGIGSIERGIPGITEHYEGYPIIAMVDEHGCMTGHEPTTEEVFQAIESSEGVLDTHVFETTYRDVKELIVLGIEELHGHGYAGDVELQDSVRRALNTVNTPDSIQGVINE